MRRYQAWTNEEDEELRTLVQRGYTNKEISKKIGRTTSAIKSRRNILGLTNMHYETPIPRDVRDRIDKIKAERIPKQDKKALDVKLTAGKDYLVIARGTGHLKRDEINRKIMTYLGDTENLFVFEGENYKETYIKHDVLLKQPEIREVAKTDY